MDLGAAAPAVGLPAAPLARFATGSLRTDRLFRTREALPATGRRPIRFVALWFLAWAPLR